MTVTTIGIDLAKSMFQVHGVDSRGHAVLRKQLKRIQLQPFFANLPPCLIGMESCSGSHYFARQLEALGHTVRLIAPQPRAGMQCGCEPLYIERARRAVQVWVELLTRPIDGVIVGGISNN